MFQLTKMLVVLSACCEACLAALKSRGNVQQKGSKHAPTAETSVSAAVVPLLQHLGSTGIVVFNSRRLHATLLEEFTINFSHIVRNGTQVTLCQSGCLIIANQRICLALLKASQSQCSLPLL